jgi:hypothetical protein
VAIGLKIIVYLFILNFAIPIICRVSEVTRNMMSEMTSLSGNRRHVLLVPQHMNCYVLDYGAAVVLHSISSSLSIGIWFLILPEGRCIGAESAFAAMVLPVVWCRGS